MQNWIGTSGYQYPEWNGGFYPEKLSKAKMLGYYSERFNTTESNYTFRSLPSEKTIARWSDETPSDFKFSCKAPQKVTHFSKLRSCGDTIAELHRAMKGLGTKRGAILFQLPSSFTVDAPLLEDFLATLPPGMNPAFEFRHESWLDDAVFSILGKHNVALCLAEGEDVEVPRIATADFGYLRLRREDYATRDLENWAEFLQEQEGTWREVFIYFKHEETGIGPKFATQMQSILRSA